uniref:Tyrosinase copper-binding domain-containing protein n=1 Tax=Portulaca oleracea TaxID=46147 RepID=I4DD59_POROL|nr:hypothetical protein [Portulaca oleracea]
MASITPLSTTNAATISATSTTNISNPLFPKTSQLSIPKCRKSHLPTRKISCSAAKNDDQNPRSNTHDGNANNKLDRRNMLIGLGGLYGAATNLGGAPASFAAPIATPDLSKCEPADLPSNAIDRSNCCPPVATNIIDYTPSASSTLRVRPPAHAVDATYLAKFNKAIAAMKALPSTDPRSFIQQARVHCAYCDGGYNQVGFPNLDLQVHGSWLFLPFHRYYLYFFERILGSLINDPTFAIPFWNWDHPDGMKMPSIYTNTSSPLYDRRRDAAHQPPTVIDLNYDGSDDSTSDNALINANLTVMYQQIVRNASTPRLFLGQPYRAGDASPGGSGSLENVPHGPVHVWTGDRNQPNNEDMGTFYTAAKDPIFYAHHANVDRMWSVWKSRRSNPTAPEFTDTDWLNASFIFYDENKQAVRVRVKDCLDTKKLGYTYQNVDLPWLNSRPTSRASRVTTLSSTIPKTANAAKPPSKPSSSSNVTFPKRLDSAITIDVKRPKKSRSKKEKKGEEEVLVVEIEIQRDVHVNFDVFVNDEDDVPSKKNRAFVEHVGSFVNVPHHQHRNNEHGKKMKTFFRVGLNEAIEDLGADDDEGITVTLVPRTGGDAVVIKGLKIEFDY